ncbi:MAG: glycosyltransferase family 1 protein [Patescibacteria group bacterium]
MILGIDLRCLESRFLTGVGEYTLNVILNLLKNYPNLKIIGYTNKAKATLIPAELKNKIELIHTRYPNKIKNLLYTLRLGRGLDEEFIKAGFRPDIIWLPAPAFIKFHGKIPAVVTIHDLSFVHFPKYFPLKGRFWYYPYLRRQLTNGLYDFTKIIAVTNHTKNDLVDTYPKLKNKVEAVIPGLSKIYSTSKTPTEISAVKNKYHLPNQYLLTLGTIEPRKNYLLIFEAIKDLRTKFNYNLDLVVAGTWGWCYGEIKLWLKNNPDIAKHIHITGFIDGVDKPALYQGAKIFLFPSFYEGIGMPPMESAASGVPVITTSTSSLPEVIGDGGLMVSPYHKEMWVSAIKYLLDNDEARAKLSAAGQLQMKKFSWDKTASEYYKIFSNLTK